MSERTAVVPYTVFENLLVFGDLDWVWDVVPAMQVDNMITLASEIETTAFKICSLGVGTNTNKSYSYVLNIDNSSGLRP